LVEEVFGRCRKGERTIKIYTGTGDSGKTSLFSGERVDKSHRRIEACGQVDELNACMGMLVSSVAEEAGEIIRELRDIQSRLFYVGAGLAAAPGSPLLSSIGKLGEKDIRTLEESMDRMERELPSQSGFILPGGHPSAAVAHLARTVCRRVERRVWALIKEEGEEGGLREALIYLNRLSDYLFLLARYLNRMMGVPEIPWVNR